MKTVLNIFTLLVTLFAFNTNAKPLEFTPNVMAPTHIQSEQEWKEFEEQLDKIKEVGVHAIATQIWWGLVETTDNNFNWQYYERLSSLITSKGYKWIPHIAFHSCSEISQKNCNISLPHWIWNKYPEKLKYKDESGSTSTESISVWATEIILDDYKDFLISFHDRFSNISDSIEEVTLGIGPKGELRYPSFTDVQDNGKNQAHSQLALESYRQFLKSKYKTIDNVNSVWESEYEDFSEIYSLRDSDLDIENQTTKDFYHWYNQSLIDHSEILLTTASRIFTEEKSLLRNISLGVKIPNIHWGRTAELNAGLIRIDENFLNESIGLSYNHLISSIKNSIELTKNESIFFTYTALEKSNIDKASRANDLVSQVAKLALESNIKIRGENSTSNKFGSNQTWDNMWSAIQNNNYSGLTLYRIENITSNPLAFDFLEWIIDNMKN